MKNIQFVHTTTGWRIHALAWDVKRDGLAGPDVGFALLPAYRGLGYAHEAGVASLDFARQVLNVLERPF